MPDGPPTRVGVTIADSGTGLHLAVGILSALCPPRHAPASGGRVEVALQDAIVNLMRNAMAPTYVAGAAAARTGSAYVTSVPSDLYPCRPGGPNDYLYILLAAKQHWESLLQRHRPRGPARRPALRPAVGAQRAPRGDARDRPRLDASRATSSRRWSTCRSFGVPCGAVLDTAELLANEQLRACGMIVDHHHPQWGDIRVPGCPIRIDGFSATTRSRAGAGRAHGRGDGGGGEERLLGCRLLSSGARPRQPTNPTTRQPAYFFFGLAAGLAAGFGLAPAAFFGAAARGAAAFTLGGAPLPLLELRSDSSSTCACTQCSKSRPCGQPSRIQMWYARS